MFYYFKDGHRHQGNTCLVVFAALHFDYFETAYAIHLINLDWLFVSELL